YSIAYARDDAQVLLRSRDATAAPVLSLRQVGLGRSAAFLGEADGELSGGLAAWDGYGDLMALIGRWIAGGEPPASIYATARREGAEGVIEVETAPGAEALAAGAAAHLIGDDGRPARVP